MIGISLVHVAILTNIAVAHSGGIRLDLREAFFKAENKPETSINGWRWGGDSTESTVEKVVIRDTALSEKCGLGAEPTAPIDAETTALADKARHFVSSIDWIAQRKDAPPAKPDASIRANWTKRFAIQWDEDGGFSLGGKYFPVPEDDWNSHFGSGPYCHF
jgi:hypothetical protein